MLFEHSLDEDGLHMQC